MGKLKRFLYLELTAKNNTMGILDKSPAKIKIESAKEKADSTLDAILHYQRMIEVKREDINKYFIHFPELQLKAKRKIADYKYLINRLKLRYTKQTQLIIKQLKTV